MNERKRNDWETPIDESKRKEDKSYNLENIYEHAHSELSLQQSKRDQIITIYLALCSFLLPFALGEETISVTLKGVIFIAVGIVGILFSLSTIRYREYKEIYWLCCRAIMVLQGFKPEEIDKSVIQSTFYHCLTKRGADYLEQNGDTVRLKKLTFVKKNIFSSETLHFAIIDLMAAFISGLGLTLVCGFSPLISLLIGVLAGLAVFLLLLIQYFKTCLKVYSALEVKGEEADRETRDRAFNKTFSKAWFLHFYYDPENLQEEADEKQ